MSGQGGVGSNLSQFVLGLVLLGIYGVPWGEWLVTLSTLLGFFSLLSPRLGLVAFSKHTPTKLPLTSFRDPHWPLSAQDLGNSEGS